MDLGYSQIRSAIAALSAIFSKLLNFFELPLLSRWLMAVKRGQPRDRDCKDANNTRYCF